MLLATRRGTARTRPLTESGFDADQYPLIALSQALLQRSTRFRLVAEAPGSRIGASRSRALEDRFEKKARESRS